ncbi:MAG: hypothetical protein WKG00_08790 [Polyangiaceae bacterium]
MFADAPKSSAAAAAARQGSGATTPATSHASDDGRVAPGALHEHSPSSAAAGPPSSAGSPSPPAPTPDDRAAHACARRARRVVRDFDGQADGGVRRATLVGEQAVPSCTSPKCSTWSPTSSGARTSKSKDQAAPGSTSPLTAAARWSLSQSGPAKALGRSRGSVVPSLVVSVQVTLPVFFTVTRTSAVAPGAITLG